MALVDIFEKKIAEIEKRIGDLERVQEESSKRLVDLIVSVNNNASSVSNLQFLISFGPTLPKTALEEAVKSLLRRDKELLDEHPLFREVWLDQVKLRMVACLTLFVQTRFSFDEVASILLDVFGSKTSSEVVPVEAIVRAYGADNASKWKELVGL